MEGKIKRNRASRVFSLARFHAPRTPLELLVHRTCGHLTFPCSVVGWLAGWLAGWLTCSFIGILLRVARYATHHIFSFRTDSRSLRATRGPPVLTASVRFAQRITWWSSTYSGLLKMTNVSHALCWYNRFRAMQKFAKTQSIPNFPYPATATVLPFPATREHRAALNSRE